MRSSFNWFYGFIGILLLAMLFISARFFRGSGNSSIGIAQADEYKIKAEKSSLIVKVHVVAGRQVKKGDMLVELSSQELEINIDKLSSRIAVLKSELLEKSKLVEAEIAYERAQKGITLEEINTKIGEIESNTQLNKALAEQFLSDRDTVDQTKNPNLEKLKSLELQKSRHRAAMDIKIEDIKQQKLTEQSILSNQVRLMERELQLLKDESKKLSKFALADGVVGNIYVKDGEQVDAFAPLMSINPTRPSTVVGYMVGHKINIPGIGATVIVSSYDARSLSVNGKVIGYGSVAELPEILQKSTAVKAFGREVFIEIGEENNFANGEKVLIR